MDEAISYIRNIKEPILLDIIKKIHTFVFKNSKSFAGKFRKKGEEVVVIDGNENVVREGAPQARINHLLRELIEWYNKTRTGILV